MCVRVTEIMSGVFTYVFRLFVSVVHFDLWFRPLVGTTGTVSSGLRLVSPSTTCTLVNDSVDDTGCFVPFLRTKFSILSSQCLGPKLWIETVNQTLRPIEWT